MLSTAEAILYVFENKVETPSLEVSVKVYCVADTRAKVTIIALVPYAVWAFKPPAVMVELPAMLTLKMVEPPDLKSKPFPPVFESQFTAQ